VRVLGVVLLVLAVGGFAVAIVGFVQTNAWTTSLAYAWGAIFYLIGRRCLDGANPGSGYAAAA
jgi:hypothetical protein